MTNKSSVKYIALVLLLSLTLVACGNQTEKQPENQKNESQTTEADANS